VDSYTVTSSDGSVVGVALAGPVVTLTGVAAGSGAGEPTFVTRRRAASP